MSARFKILYSAMMGDQARNQMIIADIAATVQVGRSPLVLTHRTEHLDSLASALSGVAEVIVLKGGMGKKQRKEASTQIVALPNDQPRIVLATGSYIGEGFDDSRLDTLILTMPISWRGTLQQYVGRLHRIHQGKTVVRVYDYVDGLIPMLARMYARRLRGYRAIGYELEVGDPNQRHLL